MDFGPDEKSESSESENSNNNNQNTDSESEEEYNLENLFQEVTMATNNQIFNTLNALTGDLRTYLQNITGLDPRANAGANALGNALGTVGNNVTNLQAPVNRAARVGELPLYYGGDQDPNEWIRDMLKEQIK